MFILLVAGILASDNNSHCIFRIAVIAMKMSHSFVPIILCFGSGRNANHNEKYLWSWALAAIPSGNGKTPYLHHGAIGFLREQSSGGEFWGHKN